MDITLQHMTPDMYHAFFREYENDPDLYLDKSDFSEYRYDATKVDAYIQKQIHLKRIPFAIMYGEDIAGELKLYDIVPGVSATLGITVKNHTYKDRGFGTRAEQLAVSYAFEKLDVPVVFADSILTNTRSQHVLEKVGFQFLYGDDQKKYYRIQRNETTKRVG